jgi:hypothetical protein
MSSAGYPGPDGAMLRRDFSSGLKDLVDPVIARAVRGLDARKCNAGDESVAGREPRARQSASS